MPPVIVNNIELVPIPGQVYPRPYYDIFNEAGKGEYTQIDAIRDLVLNDLFFIVYFIMGIPGSNHPFVIKRCMEAQEQLNRLYEDDPTEPRKRLNVWARYHYKTSIRTIASTVQYHLRKPEECTCIFSFKKPAGEDFVDSIKNIYEMEIMRRCFPDRLYDNPYSDSPSWSVQNGIVIKRSNASRKEATVESSGLVEGMLTGKHFEREIFEDIETDDIISSPENIDKCFKRFEMAAYLGTGRDTDIEDVIGTFYHHRGPLAQIRDKKDKDKNPIYVFTKIPGTVDGTPTGKPVLLSEKRMESERTKQHFFSQILCDPTPQTDMKLNQSYLLEIDPKFIPKNLFKVLLVDPADDKDRVKIKNSDSWAIELIGISPSKDGDDFGINEVYLLDALIERLNESEAVDAITRMYLSGGRIMSLGYEKMTGTTPVVVYHVLEALKKKGRRLTETDHSFIWLHPAGRHKKTKILNALTWPLNNGKLFMSTSVPAAYRDRIRMEMEKFPLWHDDGIDCWSYTYDIIREDWAIRSIQSMLTTAKVVTVGALMDQQVANSEGAWG